MTRQVRHTLALLAVIAALVLAAGWLPHLPMVAPNALVHETDEITIGAIRKFVSTSGPVRALVTVSVGSQLSGQIRILRADFNSEVKAGDELAIIDDKTFTSRVEQAKSDLAAVKALLVNHEAVLLKAQAIERNTARLMSRQQTLSSQGIAAATTLDNATREAEVAQAEVAIAKAQILHTRATIAQREAQLVQAEIDLDRTRIRSPIDGTVIARTVDVGQTVAASLQAPELFKIAQDLRRIRIEAQVSEADVGAITVESNVEFRVDAYPGRVFQGKVAHLRLGGVELNNVVTYAVIIEADNDDRKLLPGMTAEANIESEKIDDALRISSDALRFKPRTTGTPGASPKRFPDRGQREFERAQKELSLTDAQIAQALQLMRSHSAEAALPRGAVSAEIKDRAASGGGPEGVSIHRLIAVVARVVTEPQSGAFERWKARLVYAANRTRRRDVNIWVLNAAGSPQARQIDLGLMDDHFAEIVGGDLGIGDRVVVRTRGTGRP